MEASHNGGKTKKSIVMKRTVILLLAILAIGFMADARQPQRGYRGFVEWSSSVRSQQFATIDILGNLGTRREATFYTGLSTSHGYQISPMFFIGAGLAMEKCTNGNFDDWVAPLFLQGRADFMFGRFTPFADVRVGANMANGVGAYFSPTIGYRLNWGRKMGVNLGLSLTLAGYKADHYEGTFTGPDSYEIYYVGTRHHVSAYFSFRLGIDF